MNPLAATVITAWDVIVVLVVIAAILAILWFARHW